MLPCTHEHRMGDVSSDDSFTCKHFSNTFRLVPFSAMNIVLLCTVRSIGVSRTFRSWEWMIKGYWDTWKYESLGLSRQALMIAEFSAAATAARIENH